MNHYNMDPDDREGYWEYTIKSSPDFMRTFWGGFVIMELIIFVGPVLLSSPLEWHWYLSGLMLVYAVEFQYQWLIHRQPT